MAWMLLNLWPRHSDQWSTNKAFGEHLLQTFSLRLSKLSLRSNQFQNAYLSFETSLKTWPFKCFNLNKIFSGAHLRLIRALHCLPYGGCSFGNRTLYLFRWWHLHNETKSRKLTKFRLFDYAKNIAESNCLSLSSCKTYLAFLSKSMFLSILKFIYVRRRFL